MECNWFLTLEDTICHDRTYNLMLNKVTLKAAPASARTAMMLITIKESYDHTKSPHLLTLPKCRFGIRKHVPL